MNASERGYNGRILVAWLNSLPEVEAILAAQFAGAQIREQNLSEWRKGGYRDRSRTKRWARPPRNLHLSDQIKANA